jgi:hypothetical protein
MRVMVAMCLLGLVVSIPASAQSVLVRAGERAFEGSAGWSVGLVSDGVEVHGSASLDGRWDVGLGINRYVADFGGDDETAFTEWAPFARYFVFKETDDDTPVSLAAIAQFASARIGDEDRSWYVLGGGRLYKHLTLTDRLDLFPYLGFALAGESYSFGAAASGRSLSLTRQFGVQALIRVSEAGWLQLSVEEHGFRRDTFRAVRAAVVVRR